MADDEQGGSPDEGSQQESDEGREHRSRGAAGEKQIYLRTVYPLNPGIPHFVDVPGGW